MKFGSKSSVAVAAVSAVLTVQGMNPVLTLIVAALAGGAAYVAWTEVAGGRPNLKGLRVSR